MEYTYPIYKSPRRHPIDDAAIIKFTGRTTGTIVKSVAKPVPRQGSRSPEGFSITSWSPHTDTTDWVDAVPPKPIELYL